MDKLFIALNKFYRPMNKHQFWYENDVEMINDAIEFSKIPQEVSDKIFEKEYKRKIEPFALF